MDEPLVRANGAGRLFARGGSSRWVLRLIDLEIRAGETVAVVGPSGCGKTTLLQLLAGLDRPTEGTVGWPALSEPLRPSGIGMSFQTPSLLPPLNVVENVAFPMLVAGIAEREAIDRSARVMAELGLTGLEQQLPEDLSGGEAQRAVIARAVALDPPLVILDEPTGQLDQRTAVAVLDAVLARRAATGGALLVATHDPAVASRVEKRVELRGGRLVAGRSLRSV